MNSPSAALRIMPVLFAGCWLGISVLPGAAASADENWAQWRGPLASGVAPNAHPPMSWSETDNIKWKVKIPGNGHSTPIIWENQIFIQTAIATGSKVQGAEKSDSGPASADPPSGNPPPRRRGGGGM